MAKGRKRARGAASLERQNGTASENEKQTPAVPPAQRSSDEPPSKKGKWVNKQRVLVFATRGITFQHRHLMLDLRTILPHSKAEPKMETKDPLLVINEICEMKNCNKCIFFETKKKQFLYMWIANSPKGPSAKFLVENIHTMAELKLTGNCLKGSRPLLSFDKTFDQHPHYALLKELFVQVFGTPRYHPQSQPFFDHVFTFSIVDNRIWFRNYQILEENGSLAEIGPRFVLNPIKIFDGSFYGQVLFSNPHYVPPRVHHRLAEISASKRYVERLEAKKSLEARRPEVSYKLDPLNEVFEVDPKADEPPKPVVPKKKKKKQKF